MNFAVIKIVFVVFAAYCKSLDAMSDEKRLIKHLVGSYENVGVFGRPVFNSSETTLINMGLSLIQILDVDEVKQTVTISAWQRFTWKDLLLEWNPSDFGGVDVVRLPSNKIWTPDIILYNSAEKDAKDIRENPAMVVVYFTGNVLWVPYVIMTFSCSMDLMNYPHDTQRCMMKFASWTYDGFKMDLDFYEGTEETDVSDYILSNEWRLIDHKAKKNVKYYPCCEEPYPDLTFYMTIKRTSGASHFSFSHTLTGLILLVSFFLPPISTTKLHMAMFVFAINMFLMFTIVAQSPPAWIPRLVFIYVVGMIVSLSSMILSTITINLANKGRYDVKLPQAIKTVCVKFLGLLCCLCYRPEDKADCNEKDWEIFTMVLDRLFFIVYLLLYVVFATTLM